MDYRRERVSTIKTIPSLKNIKWKIFGIQTYRKSSIKPPGGLFISSPFEVVVVGVGGGGVNRDRGYFGDGGLVLYKKIKIEIKKLVYKVEKLKYKKVGRRLKVMQPRIKIKSELPFGK